MPQPQIRGSQLPDGTGDEDGWPSFGWVGTGAGVVVLVAGAGCAGGVYVEAGDCVGLASGDAVGAGAGPAGSVGQLPFEHECSSVFFGDGVTEGVGVPLGVGVDDGVVLGVGVDDGGGVLPLGVERGAGVSFGAGGVDIPGLAQSARTDASQ